MIPLLKAAEAARIMVGEMAGEGKTQEARAEELLEIEKAVGVADKLEEREQAAGQRRIADEIIDQKEEDGGEYGPSKPPPKRSF